MTTKNRETWLSLQSVADELNISTRTVRRRIADGTLTAKRFGPRLIRVSGSSLDRWASA